MGRTVSIFLTKIGALAIMADVPIFSLVVRIPFAVVKTGESGFL